MKYALVNDEPQEAKPDFPANANAAASPIVAKCGEEKFGIGLTEGKRV